MTFVTVPWNLTTLGQNLGKRIKSLAAWFKHDEVMQRKMKELQNEIEKKTRIKTN
jgi:hypothetical protein